MIPLSVLAPILGVVLILAIVLAATAIGRVLRF